MLLHQEAASFYKLQRIHLVYFVSFLLMLSFWTAFVLFILWFINNYKRRRNEQTIRNCEKEGGTKTKHQCPNPGWNLSKGMLLVILEDVLFNIELLCRWTKEARWSTQRLKNAMLNSKRSKKKWPQPKEPDWRLWSKKLSKS